MADNHLSSKNKYAVFLMLNASLIIFLWLTSCIPLDSAQQHTETPASSSTAASLTPPAIATIISNPTSPSLPPYTPIPTISNTQEAYMVAGLRDEDCNLPCYIGIIPGVTSWKETQEILSNLGATYLGDYWENNLHVYSYRLWIGDPAFETVTRTPKMVLGTLEITQLLDITIENGVIQRLKVSVLTRSLADKYQNYWSKYSLWEIFMQYGLPNEIYFSRMYSVNNATSMVIVYDDLGVVMEFDGPRQGNVVCPKFESENYIERRFFLTNTSSSLSLYPSYLSQLTDRTIWLPIDDVLEINKTEFYNKLLEDPTTCFNVRVVEP